MTHRPLLAFALLLAAACGDADKPAPASPASGAPAPAFDAVAEATASYRVHGAISPAVVARGGKASLTLEIELTRRDVHVQAEFPLRVSLSAGPGVGLAKAVLGHADAVEPGAPGRRWEVAVEAGESGPRRVEAAMRFAICKESEPAWCITRDETVSVPFDVR